MEKETWEPLEAKDQVFYSGADRDYVAYYGNRPGTGAGISRGGHFASLLRRRSNGVLEKQTSPLQIVRLPTMARVVTGEQFINGIRPPIR